MLVRASKSLSWCALVAAASACGPAPRRIAPPPPPPPRVVASAAPSSAPPPPAEVVREAPPEIEITAPGCAVASDARDVAEHVASDPGFELTSSGDHVLLAWTSVEDGERFQPRGALLDADGVVIDRFESAPRAQTLSVQHVIATIGRDEHPRLVVDRIYRMGDDEITECGNRRGHTARFAGGAAYEPNGSDIHFDMASCRSFAGSDGVFTLSTLPARDEDLFSGTVYLQMQTEDADNEHVVRIGSYSESQDVFDHDVPWLHAVSADGPLDAVVAPLRDGGYALAWRQRGQIWLQRLGANLAPRGSARAISTRGLQVGPPRVTANDRDIVVVYAQRANAHARAVVHADRVPLGNGASTHVTLVSAATNAVAPSVLALQNGFAVAWTLATAATPQGPESYRGMLRMFDNALRPIGDARALGDIDIDGVQLTSRDGAHVTLAMLEGIGSTRNLTTRRARCVATVPTSPAAISAP